MAIAGHVSPKMLAHYSHVRLQAKRAALDALSLESGAMATERGEATNSEDKQGGYDTNHVTSESEAEGEVYEVLEKYGRPGRTRTSDLFRVKEAL